MRALLALGLLITLCASASAATVHHSRTHHPVFIPSSVANSFAAVPAGYPTITMTHQPSFYTPGAPSYDDPSKLGGTPKQTLNGR